MAVARVGFVLAMHGCHADFLCGGVAAWLKLSSRQTWQLNCEFISFSASASLGCRDSNCLLQYSQMPRAVEGVRFTICRLRFGMKTVSHRPDFCTIHGGFFLRLTCPRDTKSDNKSTWIGMHGQTLFASKGRPFPCSTSDSRCSSLMTGEKGPS